MSVSDRLRVVFEEHGLTVKEAAARCGIPYRTLQNYVLGTSDPNSKYLSLISTEFGISLNWLVVGRGSMNLQQAETEEDNQTKSEEFSYVTDMHNSNTRYAFRTSWLNKKGYKATELTFLEAKDDSMRPAIQHGDKLLIKVYIQKIREDTENTTRIQMPLGLPKGELPDKGFYVVKLANKRGFLVRQLRPDKEGGLYIFAGSIDDSWRLGPDELDQITVIGKVIWFGRSL